jgi:DNA-binding transcriptional ArsR family regulator
MADSVWFLNNSASGAAGNHPEPAKESVLTEQEVYDVTEILKLLCDPTRAQIILVLSGTELCVCDISKLLNMTSSAISHQLRLLKQVRIVKSRRDGRAVYYRLSDRRMLKILNIAFEHVTEEQEYKK